MDIRVLGDNSLQIASREGEIYWHALTTPAAGRQFGRTFAESVSGSSNVTGDLTRDDPARALFADVVHRGMVLFILGHEYAHVYLGHLDGDTRIASLLMFDQSSTLPRTVQVETAKKSLAQELAADKEGVRLMASALDAEPETSASRKGAALGPSILFAWLEIMEDANAYFRESLSQNKTAVSDHPTAMTRRLAVEKEILAIWPEVNQPIAARLHTAWFEMLHAFKSGDQAQKIRELYPKVWLEDCN